MIMEQMPIVIRSLNIGFIQTLKLFFVTLAGALPLGLVIAFGSMSRFRPVSWLTRIVVNECLSRLRRRRPSVPLEDWDGAEEQRDHDELWDLRRSLDTLDPKLRTIIILRFFEDRKLEEIAEITRTPLSTVKTRLYRALAQLRLHLEEQEMLS